MRIYRHKIPYGYTIGIQHRIIHRINDRNIYKIKQLRQDIIHHLSLDPTLSIGQLAIKLNVNINTIKYHIRYLQAHQNLDHIGSNHQGIWVVKPPPK